MEKISLELGGGGKTMRDFISRTILPIFGNARLAPLLDSALLPGKLAFTTDSYVVDPIFFPGGNIGDLAVNGTVNDLVVSGAEPLFLSLALIIEEGLETAALERILRTIRKAADRAGVLIVTGDTKVVRRGQGDGLYINTSGIGRVVAAPKPKSVRPGDKLILTGTLGEHSLAILAARGEFGFENPVKSDCAPLTFLLPLWKKGVRWMRDITRGGLATILSELAADVPCPLLIEEKDIPLSTAARSAAGLLGIDPLFLACEGRAVLAVPENRATGVLETIRRHPGGRRAAVIGRAEKTVGRPGELLLRTQSGGLRLLEPLTSELLPRIC
ncbi:MAG: hydrogenase expression/formation protein HypE [Candidatus Aminicenantes bacterium]|nr:hydrogenase expression/formation protein HypE [Candidatus Aminicenantes bacterium]